MKSIQRVDPISIFEEILNPFKGNTGMSPRTWEVGTKEKPTIVVRRELVEKKYKAWQEEDGSYHEELITESENKSEQN